MTKTTNNVAVQTLQLLKEKLNDWRNGTEPAWRSTWPVFERLIIRHDEMQAVYAELGEMMLTTQQLWVFMEQCVFAGAFGTAEQHAALRAEHDELTSLNEEISIMSIKLAQRLRRRSDILNRNGSFSIDRIVRLTDYLDATSSENGLYRSFIQLKLEELNDFDLKYWPDIADVLQTLGEEPVEIEFLDDASEAIISARRPSLTDFFKNFFSHLHDVSDGSYWLLPKEFRISDGGIATLANILCDLAPERMLDEGYVKRLRQRLREQNFTAVW